MAATARTPEARFNELVDQFVQDQLTASPESATFLGVTTHDHSTTDMSAGAIRLREARERQWLRTFERVNTRGLTETQLIDRELVVAGLSAAAATADFESWRRAPEEYVNDGVFDLFVHGIRPEAQAVSAAIDRLAAVPATVAAAIRNIDPTLASPDIIRRDLGTVRGAAEFLRGEVGDLVNNPALRQQLLTAAEPAARAYDSLAEHLERLAPKATGTFVYGERRYNAVLQKGEQFSLSARQLRDVGWQEYRRLDTEMQAVAKRISGSADWKALLPTLQQQHPANAGEMLRSYRDTTARARQFVIDHDLMTVPAGERCVVDPAPAFERAATAVASYFPPAALAHRGHGIFNVPYPPDDASATELAERLESNADYEIPSTTAHEAYPGHHLHFVHMANASPLRQLMQSTYFIEGWGLYAEQMMAEQGFYRNDGELLGQIGARIMRAARVVVDTSLHLGEMTADQATSFMHDNVGLPPSVARAEALRYAAWPTQASAYLTGALAIQAARDRWLTEKRGTLRQFHDAITDQGALPPGLAARAIGVGEPPQQAQLGVA